MEDLYSKSISAIKVGREVTEWFKVIVEVRQGCNLSPYLFNLILEAMMEEALKSINGGVMDSESLTYDLQMIWIY